MNERVKLTASQRRALENLSRGNSVGRHSITHPSLSACDRRGLVEWRGGEWRLTAKGRAALSDSAIPGVG